MYKVSVNEFNSMPYSEFDWLYGRLIKQLQEEREHVKKMARANSLYS